MANCCLYSLKAVAEDKSALERFLNVLKYEDGEMFIPRIFSSYAKKIAKERNSGLWSVKVIGDTAWNCDHWFCSDNKEKELVKTDKDGKDYKVDGCYLHGIESVCEKLNIGVEIWSEEGGCCFQEHYIVNHLGEVTVNEVEEWHDEYEDEDGEVVEAEGGFEDYDEFSYNTEIFWEN